MPAVNRSGLALQTAAARAPPFARSRQLAQAVISGRLPMAASAPRSLAVSWPTNIALSAQLSLFPTRQSGASFAATLHIQSALFTQEDSPSRELEENLMRFQELCN